MNIKLLNKLYLKIAVYIFKTLIDSTLFNSRILNRLLGSFCYSQS